MTFAMLEGPDLIIVLAIVLLIFGGSRLPGLARSLGEAQREFRKAQHDDPPPADPVPLAQPVPTQAAPVVEAALVAEPTPALPPSSDDEEHITLTRSQLDALLDEHEARIRSQQPDQRALPEGDGRI